MSRSERRFHATVLFIFIIVTVLSTQPLLSKFVFTTTLEVAKSDIFTP